MELGLLDVAVLVGVGCVAGVLGGMLGIGGSVVMLPAMAILFAGEAWGDQHLWQASAMLVNVAIAVPSARGHAKKGNFRRGMFLSVLPGTAVMIVVGVLVSNAVDGEVLRRLLGVFLVYVSASMAWQGLRKKPDLPADGARVDSVRGSVVGGVMGFMAGLLGIGGAVIATPLAQLICKWPLRNAIAVSAAVMCVTSPVGAGLKVHGVTGMGRAWWEPVVIFACLAPSAMVCARAGAWASHLVPVAQLRLVFAGVLVLAAVRLMM